MELEESASKARFEQALRETEVKQKEQEIRNMVSSYQFANERQAITGVDPSLF